MRNKRMLVEQLRYNHFFRCFVGLGKEREGLASAGVLQEAKPASARGRGAAVVWRDRKKGETAETHFEPALFGGRGDSEDVGVQKKPSAGTGELG